ncbi:MAG: polyribonucleotide nucleotidyltransferase [Alphaproteobacteria bacterium]|nr:polyribonucleotide nucleotidyltransferase [Alphaproteobacteria bacterium]
MFNIIEKKINWAGKELSFQTGKIARQADGAVVATYGGTSVLATVVFGKNANYELDFFPLTVNYQDKYYAVGKIPGGFFKRETKPTEREVLISRLIDRPIRPLFDERFRNEVQVIVSTLSSDKEVSTDVLSILAASAALSISGAPFLDTVGAAKVGYIGGEYVLNPTIQQTHSSSLELVVAGTKEGILMVESEAQELLEEVMLGALKFAHEGFAPVINLINEFKQAVNKTPYEVENFDTPEVADFIAELNKCARENLVQAFAIKDKTERSSKISEAKDIAKAKFADGKFEESFVDRHFSYYFKALEKDIVRGDILSKSVRIDGRNLEQIRPITTEIDLFPAPHGSALFTRGETQALVFATLGTEIDEQMLDDIENDNAKERFMLHYNFPPFSVGEVGRVGAPGRREIGHGKLAWRAIHPLLPSKEDFPYTIRLVSEITESNGSSSMATVCGSSLALMSAGVPLARPIAGIAMGLIKEGDKYAVLSDILGDEDHLGDMDFKVAGTSSGITSLQMDIKITSITYEIMEKAVSQAHAGRQHILGEMAKSISSSKANLSGTAPKIKTIQIDASKIKDIIGTGGKIIKEICEKFDVKIDISNEGLVKVAGINGEKVDGALEHIAAIVAVPEVGKVYKGKVVKLLDFGAFVNFMPNRDGFLHISEMSDNRNSNINDFLKVGDVLDVKVAQIDDKGKIRLTVKI